MSDSRPATPRLAPSNPAPSSQAPSSPAPSSTGRTQAERREATRQALLDATVDSLTTRGLAATSARRVAEAAGVSQGALQHHFPTKFALVEAALSAHLVSQLDELAVGDVERLDERERAIELLDRLWRFHRIPIFDAVFELLAVAQRDAAIAEVVGRYLAVLLEQGEASAREVLPEAAADPAFGIRWHVAVDAVRGAALLAGLRGAGLSGSPDWSELRDGLVEELLAHA